MASKDNVNNSRDLKEELLGARDYVKQMSNSIKEMAKSSKLAADIASQINSEMKTQTDYSDRLNTLLTIRDDYMKEQIAKGDSISDNLLDAIDHHAEILETAIDQAKQNDKIEESQNNIKDITKDFGNNLAHALGISGELIDAFKTLSITAIGLYVLKVVLDELVSMVHNAIELHHQFGASTAEAAQMQLNLLDARMSMEGFMLGADKLSASMNEIVKTTGRLQVPGDTITDVAALTEMISSEDSIALVRTLENSGIKAGELRHEVNALASEAGVNAADAFDYLAEIQIELVGLSKEQVLQKAQEGIAIKQMGIDAKKLVDIQRGALDIEKSMKDEMKIRMLTGKNINFNALRQAHLSGDAVQFAEEHRRITEQLGDDLSKNRRLQGIYAETMGMTVEEANQMINASKEQKVIDNELTDIMKERGLATQEEAQKYKEAEATKQAELQSTMKTILIVTGVVGGLVAAFFLLKSIGIGSIFAKAMPQISAGLTSLSPAIPVILTLAAAIVGIGFALKLAAPGIKAFGTAISGIISSLSELIVGVIGEIPSIINAVANGFTTIMDSISMEKITAMYALGPALFSIAGGLAAVGTAGLISVPGIMALNTLTSIAPSLAGIADSFNTDDSGDSDSELVEEVRKIGKHIIGLRDDIQSQPIVLNVDGKTVSQISKVQSRQMVNKRGFK